MDVAAQSDTSRDAFASIDASAPSLDAPATLLVKQLSSGQQTIVTHGDGFGIDAFRFGTSALCQSRLPSETPDVPTL